MLATKKVLIGVSLLGLILIVTGIVFAYRSYSRIVVVPNRPVTTPPLVVTPTPDPDRPFSVLLMGYGGGKHEGGRLTDSIMVIRFEPKQKKITLVSVPRDLWVQLPVNGEETKGYKVNAAYAIGSDDRNYPHKKVEFTGPAGGGEMAKAVISRVVGFPIDYFVALDFQGFVKSIDVLGGVYVNVAKTFDDPLYPIEKDEVDNCGKSPEEIAALTATLSGTKLEQAFSCRYETLHFDKGLQLMDGATALRYVRSRHSPTDGGDFNRSARQRLLLEAVQKRVVSLGFIPKILPFIRTLASHLQTDVRASRLEEFLSKAEEYGQYRFSSVALTDQNVLTLGTSVDHQSILIPKMGENNWDQVHQFIQDPTILTPVPTVSTNQ